MVRLKVIVLIMYTLLGYAQNQLSPVHHLPPMKTVRETMINYSMINVHNYSLLW